MNGEKLPPRLTDQHSVATKQDSTPAPAATRPRKFPGWTYKDLPNEPRVDETQCTRVDRAPMR